MEKHILVALPLSEAQRETIRQAAPDGRPTGRLSYTFRADGVAGPSDGVATYYEYIRF